MRETQQARDPEPIAIFGAGLLGGSLALAAARVGWPIRLAARREEAVAQWQEIHGKEGVLISTDPAEILAGARLVVLAVPPEAMGAALDQVFAAAADPARLLITDVGSVKAPIERELLPRCEALGAHFIGSHPMAGDENNGLAFARASLFKGTRCALCPPSQANPVDVERVSTLWRAVGCKLVCLEAQEHDCLVGRVSHLVHLASGALIRAAAAKGTGAFELAGPGLRDSTRVAAGPVPLWLEIAEVNRDQIVAGLEDLSALLASITEQVRTGDREGLSAALSEARQLRRMLDEQG